MKKRILARAEICRLLERQLGGPFLARGRLNGRFLAGALGVYTAVVSEEIAARLDAIIIAQRSPSFYGFLEAVRNGKPD